jgi:hypothetical protein
MKKLLLAVSALLLGFGTSAQTIAIQGFDASSNTWSYTTTPAPYNFPSLNDIWADTTALGNTTSGNVPITAAFEGSRFWAMNDLDNPATTSLGAPYYHYIDLAPVALNPATVYAIKFKYFTHIVGGTGDSLGYIVEYNNGTTWSAANYVNLPGATKKWDSVAVSVPAGSTFARLRIVARLNGNDDWYGVDKFEIVAGATVTPSLTFEKNLFVYDEAADTVKIRVIRSNKNAINTTVNISATNGFGTTDTGDMVLLTPSVTFTPSGSDTQFVSIKMKNDAVKEVAEYFGLELTGAVNANLGANKKLTAYVKDNDYTAPVARKNIELSHVSSYDINIAGSSAEIVSYDSASNRLFVVNSLKNKLHILNFNNPAAVTEVGVVDMSAYGGGINSVAVRNGIVAVAVEASPKTDSGKVVFLDTAGTFLKEVKAGALPDMITFSPDGKYVVTANEGEPNADYTIDPEGSITVVDIQSGVAGAVATTMGFASFNGTETVLRAQGIRIYGVSATAAKDFEPEYVTITKTSDTAWVTLQENNAIMMINIKTKAILGLFPLGTANHMSAGAAIDASDNNGEVMIANWPVKGMYLPDAIANYTKNGKTYLVTANEGDAREYDVLEEEARIGSGGYVLDPVKFPHADLLKANHNLGRLNAVTTMGDTDNDGDIDEIHVLGSRSFTIWDGTTGTKVYDNGHDFEQITLADPKVGKIFNADNGNNSKKNRSDNKGPEPEGVTTGVINDTTYAFIALERIGGVMVYDVNNPTAPAFVQYINTRDTATYGGDNGAEGIIFLHAKQNRNGKHYVLTANEVSGTLAIFEVKAATVSVNHLAKELPILNVYPNPVNNDQLYFSQPISGGLYDMQGRKVMTVSNANSIQTQQLAKGMYILRANGFKFEKVAIQ